MSKLPTVKTIAYLTDTSVNYFHHLGLGKLFCVLNRRKQECKGKKIHKERS